MTKRAPLEEGIRGEKGGMDVGERGEGLWKGIVGAPGRLVLHIYTI